MNKEVILGLVRHVLTAAGGAVVGNGLLAADEVTAAVGAIVTILGLVWSVLDKKKK